MIKWALICCGLLAFLCFLVDGLREEEGESGEKEEKITRYSILAFNWEVGYSLKINFTF
jgi:hypothetical protein